LDSCVVVQDAPYKKRGQIPYGVQRGSYGLTAEEKMRRRWREWSAAGSPSNGSGAPALAAAAAEPSYQVGTLCKVTATNGVDDCPHDGNIHSQ